MVLNEPETSLHPDLLPPLARLIARAAKRTQIIVVSHAGGLVAALEAAESATRFDLEKDLGETRLHSGDADDARPAWNWPTR
jgi:predicted ATPase